MRSIKTRAHVGAVSRYATALAICFSSVQVMAGGSMDIEVGAIGGEGSRELMEPADNYGGLYADFRGKFQFDQTRFGIRAFADVGMTDEATDVDQQTRSQVSEAFVSGSCDHWEWAAGRQRINWGRADGINPTDIWTPRQLDRPVLWEADQYLGADTLRLTRNLDDERQLSLLLGPNFRPTTFGRGLYGDLLPYLAPTDSAYADAGRPTIGLRFESMGAGLDYSFTAARTAELTPYLRPGVAPYVQNRYGRLDMLGADFAVTWDKWVYRGESALLIREHDSNRLAPASSAHVILGAERQLSDNWLINAQVLGDWRIDELPSLDSPLEPLGKFNRLLFHQNAQRDTAISFSQTFRPDDQRGQLTLVLIQYSREERYWRVRGEYPIFDRMKLGIIVERYAGPAGSSFDFLSRNNVFWLTFSVAVGNS